MGRGRGSSGRGGGGRHRNARQQPAAAPPSGEALLVELRASPEFYAALKGRECPAAAAEGSSSSGPSPMGTSELQMAQWKDLDKLLSWFRDGIAADPLAELAFSTKLTKAQRASVHGTATAVGLGGLGTASRGVGEGRCVVVLSKQRAVRPELSEKQDHQAFWTWRWAGQRGLQVSRDEVAEMILGGGLTPELQAIWDEQSALQKGVQQLCAAVTAGDAAAAAAAADAQPRLLQEGVFDVQTGVAPLHLAAREGRAELVELLLSKGAAVDSLDGHGWTALQVARKYEQSDAEGVLLRAGTHDPEKDKSILEKPAALPSDKPAAPAAPAPAPEPPLANGTKPAAPAAAAPAAVPTSLSAGSGPLSDAGSQDVYIDSLASVCGTERDNLAAEVGSNAEDYADPQYQGPSVSAPPLAIEEGEEAEDTDAAAESARAQAEAVALAAKAAAEAEAAAAEAAAEEAAAREAATAAAAAAQQAVASARAAVAAEEEGMEEEGTAEEEDEEAGSDLSIEEEEELVEDAADEAKLSACRAFSTALAAAEAAEAAAEAAESMPGEEAAQRAAAAAAVVAGEALDGVLMPRHAHAQAPPLPPSSAASVCGSEATTRSLLRDASEFGSGPLSSAGSVPAPASSSQSAPTTNQQQQQQEQEQKEPPRQAAAAAGEAALAGGAGAAAAATAAAAAAEQPEAAPQAPAEAAAGAASDVGAVASSAAEHTAGAAKSAAAAASWAASRARAELEARAPDWSQWFDRKAPEVKQWVQEHPGSVMAGAGIAAAALAALLYTSGGARRR
ncbi:hypothetical protein ABPG75_014015 [Micractinium tetrahymenae]